MIRKKLEQIYLIVGLVAFSAFAAAPLAGGAAHSKSAAPEMADRIVVTKSSRTMVLMRGDRILKTYKVALGEQPVGAKQKRGDHKTPEGDYVIDSKNPHSQFHLSLHISYPNAVDRARARKLGVSPGGDVMIHGLPPAYAYLGPRHRESDWTWGCVAVTDPEIEEIWKLVPVGTQVQIRP